MAIMATGTYNYGRRPLWQWILLYVVIGAIIYALAYYLILNRNSYRPNTTPGQAPIYNTNPAPQSLPSGTTPSQPSGPVY